MRGDPPKDEGPCFVPQWKRTSSSKPAGESGGDGWRSSQQQHSNGGQAGISPRAGAAKPAEEPLSLRPHTAFGAQPASGFSASAGGAPSSRSNYDAPPRRAPSPGLSAGGSAGLRASADSLRPSASLEPKSSGISPPPASSSYRKVAFDKEFPSLKDSKQPLGYAPREAPYKQTFLSSRTASNWTSKLAEAPALQRPPDDPPARQHSPPPGALHHALAAPTNNSLGRQASSTVSAPAPSAPAAAPTTPAASLGWSSVAQQAGAPKAGEGGAGAGGIPSAEKLREALAVKQSKQLIPVLAKKGQDASSGDGGKGKQGQPTLLGKLPSRSSGSELNGSKLLTRSGSGAPGGGLTSLSAGSGTVTLTKKASAPLDKPLMVPRVASSAAASLASSQAPQTSSTQAPVASTAPPSADATAAPPASKAQAKAIEAAGTALDSSPGIACEPASSSRNAALAVPAPDPHARPSQSAGGFDSAVDPANSGRAAPDSIACSGAAPSDAGTEAASALGPGGDSLPAQVEGAGEAGARRSDPAMEPPAPPDKPPGAGAAHQQPLLCGLHLPGHEQQQQQQERLIEPLLLRTPSPHLIAALVAPDSATSVLVGPPCQPSGMGLGVGLSVGGMGLMLDAASASPLHHVATSRHTHSLSGEPDHVDANGEPLGLGGDEADALMLLPEDLLGDDGERASSSGGAGQPPPPPQQQQQQHPGSGGPHAPHAMHHMSSQQQPGLLPQQVQMSAPPPPPSHHQPPPWPGMVGSPLMGPPPGQAPPMSPGLMLMQQQQQQQLFANGAGSYPQHLPPYGMMPLPSAHGQFVPPPHPPSPYHQHQPYGYPPQQRGPPFPPPMMQPPPGMGPYGGGPPQQQPVGPYHRGAPHMGGVGGAPHPYGPQGPAGKLGPGGPPGHLHMGQGHPGCFQQQPATKFQVSAEEEAFLRSLGWNDAEDSTDDVLTPEEIAAYRNGAQARQMAGGNYGAGAVAGQTPSPSRGAAKWRHGGGAYQYPG